MFPRTAPYVACLMTEDSTLLCSASDTVCRAMASLAAICFFFRLFRLWDGDHSCSHTNGRLQFKIGRRRKEKSACLDKMHSSSLKTVIYMEMKEQCRAKKIIVFYTSFFHTVEDFIARIYSTSCITHLSLAFIWSNEAAALLLSFWKSFKPIF